MAVCLFQAANYIYTHHFLKEQIKELIYLTDETKVKLADITKDADGILTTSKLNTTYQVLAKHFKGEIPMHILGSLNMTLTTHFNNEKLHYLRGESRSTTTKKIYPFPLRELISGNCNLLPTEKISSLRYSKFLSVLTWAKIFMIKGCCWNAWCRDRLNSLPVR